MDDELVAVSGLPEERRGHLCKLPGIQSVHIGGGSDVASLEQKQYVDYRRRVLSWLCGIESFPRLGFTTQPAASTMSLFLKLLGSNISPATRYYHRGLWSSVLNLESQTSFGNNSKPVEVSRQYFISKIQVLHRVLAYRIIPSECEERREASQSWYLMRRQDSVI